LAQARARRSRNFELAKLHSTIDHVASHHILYCDAIVTMEHAR
jgi:hypothetical protein